MENRIEGQRTIVLLVRWTARILSIFSIGLLILFFVGENFNPAQIKPIEWLGLLFFPAGISIGMILAWWKEGFGGSVTAGSLFMFYVIQLATTGSFPKGLAWLVFTVPGFLFLLHWYLTRKMSDDNHFYSDRRITGMTRNDYTLDIGCGENCLTGAIGIDKEKYSGVKYVHDLNVAPWPVKERFTSMRCQHVIEHIVKLDVLVSEMFRLSENGCIVHFVTPHYSSHASWGDPTHIHHFSLGSIPQLFDMVLGKEKFVLLQNEIRFTSSIFELIGRFICKVSPQKYEKHFAWSHPASEIHTVIMIVK